MNDSTEADARIPQGSRRALLYITSRASTPRAGTAGVAVAAVGGLFVFNPNTTHVPLCPFHAMTGLWCPLCGSTRAAYELLHLNLGAAVRDNALFVLAAPVATLLLIEWLRGKPRTSMSAKTGWAVAVVLVGFGVLRNLPFADWLAPA